MPSKPYLLITVEDILQETYIHSFRSIRSFQPNNDGSFFHWLRTIAEHRLVDAIRSQRAAKRGGGRGAIPLDRASMMALLEAVSTGEATPISHVAGREAGRAVLIAMANLTSEQREAVRLRYLEDRPIEEIAAALGRTTGAVHMLLQRALKALRKALDTGHNF